MAPIIKRHLFRVEVRRAKTPNLIRMCCSILQTNGGHQCKCTYIEFPTFFFFITVSASRVLVIPNPYTLICQLHTSELWLRGLNEILAVHHMSEFHMTLWCCWTWSSSFDWVAKTIFKVQWVGNGVKFYDCFKLQNLMLQNEGSRCKKTPQHS